MFKTATAFLMLLAFVETQASAQTSLSIADAIARAVANRPELRASSDRVVASRDVRTQAGLIPNPRFYFQSEDLRASNFSFPKDAETYAYVSELIETSGARRARTALASVDVRQSGIRADQTKAQVVVDVRRAYWSAERATFVAHLYSEDSDYFGQVIAYNTARFNEGKLAEVDLLRVRLEGERVRAAAAAMKLAQEKAMLYLATAMGISETNWTLTEPFETLEAPTVLPSDQDPVLSRPEDLQAKTAIEASHANLLLQRMIGRPDLEVLAGYKDNLGENTVIAGLQLNLPVFNRNQGAVAAATANAHAAEEDYKAVHLQLSSEVKLAKREFQFQKDEYENTFKPLRDRAVEISDITRAAYREGGIDLLRLLDAERLRVEAEASWVDALGSYHQSVVSLEYAEGVQP